MRIRTLLLGLLGVLVIGLAPLGADDKKDQAALTGTWAVTMATRGGKPNDNIKGDKLVLEETKFTIKSASGGRDQTGTFKIDSSQTPKTMDLTSEKGDMMKGIYKVSGDDLEVTFGRPGTDRPKEFGSKEGTETMHIVLKREKK
jgi:uncharacterized protein (TIGR03067 family)